MCSRHNKLKECLEFCAPLCSSDRSWISGHNAAGSLLTLADLSHNQIQHLRDLSRHQFLERLILNNNSISRIEGLHGLKYLQVLDLSFNNISTIEGLDNLPVKELRLKGNKIKQLNGLDKLPHLTSLDVSENSIISLSQLAQCTSLVHLDVSFNNVEHIRQVEFLQGIPWLTALVLGNNPCELKDLYRLRVLFRLPKLLFLDNSAASLEDKVRRESTLHNPTCSHRYIFQVRAFNLYHSVDGDLALREDVLRQYLPQVSFVDHSPQQLPHDEETDLSLEELRRGLPHDATSAEASLVVALQAGVQGMAIQEEDDDQSSTAAPEDGRSVSFAANINNGGFLVEV